VNPRLIGGEMMLWSDLAGATGPVRGAAVAPLLASVTGRTLVAGPHDPALLTGEPTLLLRGLPDAEAVAGRFPVLCGGPAKLPADPGWDTVVALDGLGRLGSAEDPEQTWEETFTQLLAVLRPGGTLLLGLENPLGVHRLVALPPALTDADWTPAAGCDETRPASFATAKARLRAAGLTLQRAYATFPAPVEPAALIDTELLADRTRRGYVEALVSSACAPLDDVLTDPRRLAVDTVRHGLGAELAPGWIFVAQREPADALPPEADIPVGDTVESLLLAAALRRDLPRIRALLTAWQSSPAATVSAAQVLVSADGGHLAVGAPGTRESALHAFAATVLSGGFAHPWPAPASTADLTLTLAAMAGVELDPAAIPPATARASMLDLLADRDRLTRELAEARAKHDFHERTIAGRDRALARERRLNALLSTTKPARALLAGARVARRLIRRLRA
jgi:hypothetical protein